MATTSVTTEVEAATSLPNTRQCPGCLKLPQYKNRGAFWNAVLLAVEQGRSCE